MARFGKLKSDDIHSCAGVILLTIHSGTLAELSCSFSQSVIRAAYRLLAFEQLIRRDFEQHGVYVLTPRARSRAAKGVFDIYPPS